MTTDRDSAPIDHLYAQLVDDATVLVLGNQVTPIPVTLDGHTPSASHCNRSQTLRPGETVTLQLGAWSVDYAANRTLGVLSVEDMRITLPTKVFATPEA